MSHRWRRQYRELQEHVATATAATARQTTCVVALVHISTRLDTKIAVTSHHHTNRTHAANFDGHSPGESAGKEPTETGGMVFVTGSGCTYVNRISNYTSSDTT